ncbi:hypothetical protein H6771_02460 [Candidatus Peribacteria bacterium]|nr:hypothetical protein [Candidatus Peribacteria bacterium]
MPCSGAGRLYTLAMVWDSLTQQARAGTLPHALLLTSDGPVRTPVLQLVAALQGCPVDAIDKGLHSDVLVLEDTGLQLRVDHTDAAKRDHQAITQTARGIVQWVWETHQSPARVVVLFAAERLNTPAQNALLKVLEEPPPGVYFLCTTTNEYQLLETLRSRMRIQRVSATPAVALAPCPLAEAFWRGDLFDRFAIAEQLHKAEDSSRQEVMAVLRWLLQQSKTSGRYAFLSPLQEAYKQCRESGNVRLHLEYLALQMV